MEAQRGSECTKWKLRVSHAGAFHKLSRRPGATGNLFAPRPPPQIGKLIRLLGSPIDAEAIAAARAMARVLTEAGTDFPHLADIVEKGWREPPPIIVAMKARPEWQTFAAELLKHQEVLLGSCELDFLNNMSRSQFCPTEKQWKWLGDIQARIPQRAATS